MSEDIQDIGLVTEVCADYVSVEVQRGGGCKSCTMRGFCFSKSSPAVFRLKTELVLQEGDMVELEISPSGRVLASMLIFVLPVLMLILGFIFSNIWFAELISILFAFSAMALSFCIIRFCDKRWGNRLKIGIARKL